MQPDAVPNSLRSGSLHLVCGRCTREDFVGGGNREESAQLAREAGWVFDSQNEMVCPKCPALGRTKRKAA